MNTKYPDLYTDYLAVTFGYATATGLSDMLDSCINYDKFTRFLADGEWSSRDLWKQVKSTVREVASEDGVLIFDDTVEEKPWMDENELICWHYDHCRGRNIKGINMLNGLYHVDDVSIPIAFDLIRKPIRFSDLKTRREKRQSEVTKNELLRLMIDACSQLTADRNTITAIYTKRWNVEVYHKSLKSNAALAKSPARRVNAQSNHIFASVITVFKMEHLKIRTKMNHFALKTKLYLKAIRSASDELQRLQAA
ncbi:MAG: transposase [Candidatus Electrothrix sp. YB6]